MRHFQDLIGRVNPDCVLDLSSVWPDSLPFLGLLGSGRYWMIAICFEEVALSSALATHLEFQDSGRLRRVRDASMEDDSAAGSESFQATLPFGTGILVVASYDDYAPNAAQDQLPARSRAFRIYESIVLDRQRGLLWHCGTPPAGGADFRVDIDPNAWLSAAWQRDKLPSRVTKASPPLPLTAAVSDAAYHALVREALDDIRAGRFYQVNLLRYFTAPRPQRHRAWAFARLLRFGGPFAALVDVPGFNLVSFSPERFVRIWPDSLQARLVAEACPIKGTAARHRDPDLDAAAAQALLASPKDRAELHMIVDLLRNDLSRISLPGTVKVVSANRLDSYANVHHLSAQIESHLGPGLTLGRFLSVLCPGGSITGAPKREAMLAIQAAEKRARGYFMGNLVWLDDSGQLDSSILIRSLVAIGDSEVYEFAAGSGIVIRSDPEHERRETLAKCAVVTWKD